MLWKESPLNVYGTFTKSIEFENGVIIKFDKDFDVEGDEETIKEWFFVNGNAHMFHTDKPVCGISGNVFISNSTFLTFFKSALYDEECCVLEHFTEENWLCVASMITEVREHFAEWAKTSPWGHDDLIESTVSAIAAVDGKT